jgi:hypothetical protein
MQPRRIAQEGPETLGERAAAGGVGMDRVGLQLVVAEYTRPATGV